jgi:hypothetical protein
MAGGVHLLLFVVTWFNGFDLMEDVAAPQMEELAQPMVVVGGG